MKNDTLPPAAGEAAHRRKQFRATPHGKLTALEREFSFIREAFVLVDAGVPCAPYSPTEWRECLIRRRQVAIELRNEIIAATNPRA